MGFNITVLGGSNSDYEVSEVFINRSYYNFVASYDLFAEQSVIMSVGDYLGLDLHPLVNPTYLDEDEENEIVITQNVDDLLLLVSALLEKVQSEPNMLNKVTYKAKSFQYVLWEEYFNSGRLVEDLKAILDSLIYHKRKGRITVCFGVY
ncbi:hypothetical protein ABIB60_003527 [Hymenobacter sp. UYP22]